MRPLLQALWIAVLLPGWLVVSADCLLLAAILFGIGLALGLVGSVIALVLILVVGPFLPAGKPQPEF